MSPRSGQDFPGRNSTDEGKNQEFLKRLRSKSVDLWNHRRLLWKSPQQLWRGRRGLWELKGLVRDLASTSVRQILRNRRRYRGAIIVTSVGIAGMTTVLTLGDSVETSLGKNLEVLGNATIVKAEWDLGRSQRWHHGEYRRRDVEDLKRLPGALSVSAAIWKNPELVSHGQKRALARLGGTDADFFNVTHLPAAQGRHFNEDDVLNRRQVCLIGKELVNKLFPPEANPIGKNILIEGRHFRVVGVLGGTEDVAFKETVLIPISVVQAKINGMGKIRDIYVRARHWNLAEGLHNRVRKLLISNQPGYADGMFVKFYGDRISSINTIFFVFRFFLYAAIVVTLVLGALGTASLMSSVVNERTREIGLRIAVGATKGIVMSQFLFESLIVGLIGSSLGALLGFLTVMVVSGIMGTDPKYDVFMLSVLLSVATGIALGVVAGLLPARKASRLTCVEAMKFE
jgi:putative ABC transport system permease protein